MKWEDISLLDFVREFWSVIEPGKTFVPGKHIEAICQHLEAVSQGKILRLLINMPPRHAKSTIISVFWPVWAWIKNPSLRFLCASYALNLATRDNVKCRRLILSPKFQEHYGHLFQLTKDQNAKMKFETTYLGYRMAVSVGSSATGEGGDILLLDDPHAIDEKESDAMRESALDWFANTWSTRLNDAQTGAMVVVGQRIHARDVSGMILAENDGEWTHLNLPSLFEPSHACETHLADGSFFWRDWRTQEDELLWPERFPMRVLERAKRRHGPLGFAALHQQNPVPPGGYIFNKANERLFTIDYDARLYLLQTPEGIRPVKMDDCALHITSDVAAKAKEQSDYTVFAVWAVTPRKEVLLLYVLREHMVIPKQVENGYLVYQAHTGPLFHAFHFEDVAYQSALGQFLLEKGVPCLPFHPVGDKVLRATGASVWMAAGNVYFLAGASWLETWRTELYQFPKGEHDDQVDTLSAIVIIVKGQPLPLQGDEPNDTVTQAGHDAAAAYLATVEDVRSQEQDIARQIAALRRQLGQEVVR